MNRIVDALHLRFWLQYGANNYQTRKYKQLLNRKYNMDLAASSQDCNLCMKLLAGITTSLSNFSSFFTMASTAKAVSPTATTPTIEATHCAPVLAVSLCTFWHSVYLGFSLSTSPMLLGSATLYSHRLLAVLQVVLCLASTFKTQSLTCSLSHG